jgi:hypothetical protein
MIALKKRKGYEPDAEQIIIREAIRRGLIHSGEDLNSPEFNPPSVRFTIFPNPESEISRGKIIKSLMRSVMIPGVIPVYYGILKFAIPKYLEGAALISVGIFWILMALLVTMKSERRLIFPMLFFLILSMVYAGRIIFAHNHLRWTDILVPVVLYIFALYSLIYSYILTGDKKAETKKE